MKRTAEQTKRQLIEAVLADMERTEPHRVADARIYLTGYTKKQLEAELAARQPEPEWPQNLGNEDLLNDYRASLMLGSTELTEALRGEILRRMNGGEEEQR